MTSAELKALITDAAYLDHRDVVFAHILIGMVVALENVREEMILISHPMLSVKLREDNASV